MFLIAIVTNGSMNLLLFAGFQAMTVALVMTVFYTYPLMVMVVQALRGQEQVTPTRVVALIIAMAGLLLVIGSQDRPRGTRDAGWRRTGPGSRRLSGRISRRLT